MTEYIGSQVSVPGTRGKAILRYCGPIKGKQGTFAGLELLGPIALTRGKNSGDVEGVQYFDVAAPNSGLFLPLERLKTANPALELSAANVFRPTSSNGSVTPRKFSNEGHQSMIFSEISLPKRGERTPSKAGSPDLRNQYSDFRPSTDYSARHASSNFVEAELVDLRQKYEKSEKEMSQKLSILNELKQTVDELQPLLKQYESELSDKDRKIYKLKSDFDTAREEWRQNLDLMVNTYEENENFYEAKIRQLQIKITENNEVSADVSELHKKIDQLTNEKIEMEGNLKSKIISLEANIKDLEAKRLNAHDGSNGVNTTGYKEAESISHESSGKTSDDYDSLVCDLKTAQDEVEKLTNQLKDSESAQAELRLKKRLLQNALEEKNSEQETPNKIKDNHVRSLEQENHKLLAQIVNLKEELVKIANENLEIKKAQEEATNNQIKTNSDTTGNKIVKDLEEDLFYKNQEIKALQQQLEKTSSIVKSQKQHIKELENKTQPDRSSVMDEDELRREFEKDKDNYVQQLNNKDNIIKELERKIQESLENELDTMKISDVASGTENMHNKEIEDLRNQLEARPTMEELIELQDNIDEMLRLHNNELNSRQDEINRLHHENSKLQTRLERVLEGSLYARNSDNASHESSSITGDLPVYQPEMKLDPSTGKDNWCGLCERDGHNSLNCPYENDIF